MRRHRGTRDLAFVSPRSGRSVSRDGAGEYRDRLLPLPGFLRGESAAADWREIMEGLAITGHFLARDLPIERQDDVFAARHRLLDRLARIAAA
jgi:DNA repair protein RecO (recombination protein O)